MIVSTKTGVTIRTATLDDIPAFVEMTNVAMAHDYGDGQLTCEEQADDWAVEHFVPERDACLIYDAAGTLVAVSELWAREPYAFPFFWATVHPDYRGQGYGGLLMDWAEERVKLNLTMAPADYKVALRAATISTNAGAAALFKARGMVQDRSFYRMQIDMAADTEPLTPVWADGIRVRNFIVGQDERATHQMIEASFRDHWNYLPQPFESFVEEMVESVKFDPAMWHLAVTDTPDGELIVGGALCRQGTNDAPDLGYVMELGVIREYRRRGIALALLHHVFADFYRRGVYQVGLGVDASSLTGATRLYEKAGMYILRQSNAYEKVLRDGHDPRTHTLAE